MQSHNYLLLANIPLYLTAHISAPQRLIMNGFNSQNELSSPIAANFCPTFFWLRFSFLCYFLLIDIGQLDNGV